LKANRILPDDGGGFTAIVLYEPTAINSGRIARQSKKRTFDQTRVQLAIHANLRKNH
jgi:hypothetical protein